MASLRSAVAGAALLLVAQFVVMFAVDLFAHLSPVSSSEVAQARRLLGEAAVLFVVAAGLVIGHTALHARVIDRAAAGGGAGWSGRTLWRLLVSDALLLGGALLQPVAVVYLSWISGESWVRPIADPFRFVALGVLVFLPAGITWAVLAQDVARGRPPSRPARTPAPSGALRRPRRRPDWPAGTTATRPNPPPTGRPAAATRPAP
jgi:hypothetical protein